MLFSKGTITVTGTNNANKRNKNLIFNNARFKSCISEINSIFVVSEEGLYIVMPGYNLLKYSDYYSMASGRLWKYHRDKTNYYENKINNANKG